MHVQLYINEESQAKLSHFVDNLLQSYSVRAIVVFGSAATNRWNYRSDIDVLIVTDSMGNNWFERTLNAYSFSIGKVQPFVVNSQEFESAIENRRYIIWEALYDGIVIRDDGIFLSMRNKLMKLVKDGLLIRRINGWEIINLQD